MHQSLLYEIEQRWQDCCCFWYLGSWSGLNCWRLSEVGETRSSWSKNKGGKSAYLKLLVVFGLEETWNSPSWRIWSWFREISNDGNRNWQHKRYIMFPKNSRKCLILIKYHSSRHYYGNYKKSICIPNSLPSFSFSLYSYMSTHSR